MTLEQLKDYFEYEKKEVTKFLERKPDWTTPREALHQAWTRTFGAARFFSRCYPELNKEIEELYDKYYNFYLHALADS